MTAADAIVQFRNAAAEHGLELPADVRPDGKFRRFSTNGKKSDDAGYCVLHDRRYCLAGTFGDFRSGIQQSWHSRERQELSPEQRRELEALMKASAQEAKAERDAGHLEARKTAEKLWTGSTEETGDHPYLKAKDVRSHGLRSDGHRLLVPMYAEGEIWSLQYIYLAVGEDRKFEKRYLPKCRVKGCHHFIGSDRSEICIAEGYATAATIHESTGRTVVVAFDSGNMIPVAEAIHAEFPQAKLIICADDDYKRDDNPGVTKATKAATAVGGLLVIPDFSKCDRGEKDTDFNDLARLHGPEVVRQQIEQACLQGPVAPAPDPAGVWPELQEISAHIAAEAPFPIDALPGLIGDAVREYQAYGQQPIPLVASSALAVVSLAVQGHYDVARDSTLTGPTSLNSMVIAQSGERKTAADKVFSAPIRDWERRRASELKDEIERSKADLAAWVAENRGLTNAIEKAAHSSGGPDHADELRAKLASHMRQKPDIIQPPRLTYEDANPQSLPYALQHGHPSASLWSDEGAVVTGSHGMGKESFAGFMGLLNRLWDGGRVDQDRKAAPSVHIDRRRLTVSLMVQPIVLQELAARAGGMARGSGNLARYLITAPDTTMGGRFYIDPPQAMPAVTRFQSRITDLLDLPLALDENGGLTPQILQLSAGAKSIWRDYHDEIERELGKTGEYAELRDFGSKSAENAARIAACLHAFNRSEGAITNDTMVCATRLARWYLNESLRVMDLLNESRELADARALKTFLDSRWHAMPLEARSPRYLSQHGPTSIRKKERRDAALSVLESYGHYRLNMGRRTVIERNPVLDVVATATSATSATAGSSSKFDLARVATATPATSATHQPWEPRDVAAVAHVAVAACGNQLPVSGEL